MCVHHKAAAARALIRRPWGITGAHASCARCPCLLCARARVCPCSCSRSWRTPWSVRSRRSSAWPRAHARWAPQQRLRCPCEGLLNTVYPYILANISTDSGKYTQCAHCFRQPYSQASKGGGGMHMLHRTVCAGASWGVVLVGCGAFSDVVE